MKRLAFVVVATLLVLLAGGLVLESTSALVRIIFAYVWLIFLPGMVWAWQVKEDDITTFVLANLLGFAFGFVYFFLDMVGIPLTKVTFAVVPTVIAVAGIAWMMWKR